MTLHKDKNMLSDGIKFMGGYVYKDANGRKHSHTYYRKGSKISDPILVYIDKEFWRVFQSFTKARQAAINHIKAL